jgi:hypothetical protein
MLRIITKTGETPDINLYKDSTHVTPRRLEEADIPRIVDIMQSLILTHKRNPTGNILE